MINHARTLLINRSGGKQNLADLGEEFIPTDYISLELPVWLRSFWETLFGANPGNIYRNYVADQLLRIIYATDYWPYLLTFDSRITYGPDEPGEFAKTNYNLSWSLSSTVLDVSRIGEIIADNKTGIMRWSWSLSMLAGVATIKNLQSKEEHTANIARLNEQLSAELPLPGSSVSILLFMNSINSSNWNASGTVDLLAKPSEALPDKLKRAGKLGDHFFKLFGRTGEEPFVTFSNMWTYGSLAEATAGLVLAMIYRTEEIRKTTSKIKIAVMDSPGTPTNGVPDSSGGGSGGQGLVVPPSSP